MKILITGASGIIGTALRTELKKMGYVLRLLDLVPPKDPLPDEEIIIGSIADRSVVDKAVAGVDGILHMAGCVTDADMAEQIEGNIVGAWNIFESARVHGVERVVYTSSHHVVGYYPRRRRLSSNVILRPDSRYGLTKAFGEQLGALYADKYGLRSLAIRVGVALDKPTNQRRLALWVSFRDLAHLIDIGFRNPDLRYSIVYGVSNNERSYFDNSAAYQLGYKPQDKAEDFAMEVMSVVEPEDQTLPGSHAIGAHFANNEYEGQVSRIYEW